MQRMRRFSRYWDLVANSGNFVTTTPLLWDNISPFTGFSDWCDWLHARAGKRTHGIALTDLTLFLFEYLTNTMSIAPARVATTIQHDYARAGRKDVPDPLRRWLVSKPVAEGPKEKVAPARQARHMI